MIDTVHARFVATARQSPASPFLHVESVTAASYDIPEGDITWDDAARRIEALRAAFARAGYGHGHRVGLLLENRPAFLLHWLALNALGVSVVPISADMQAAELTYLIGHSEIGLAVALPGFIDKLASAAVAAGSAMAVSAPDQDVFPSARTAPPLAGAPGAETECALLYTSGTTGRPKGCRLSNDYFLEAGRWYAAIGQGPNGACSVRPGQERIITPLPLNHVNAMAFSAMAIMTAGGCLVQLDRFHPKTWWQSVRESGATIVHYLGVMPAMLLSAPPGPSDRDHAVRWAFGAGVDRKNHAIFEERFGFPLIEGWAMTETGSVACVQATHEPRKVGTSCVGRPGPGMELRLVDDAGADVPDGVPGELLVRAKGPDPRRHFFSGYLKDEAATEAAWAGGWLHTGDMVMRDPDGSLHFVDRKKNVIRRSGENISAVEVESVLAQHPAIRSIAVSATPDAVRGDEVLACVVPREPVRPEARTEVAREIVTWALTQLAYYKVPGYVAFVDAVPLTASQKIQRGRLRELASELAGQAHCVDTRALKRRQH
jgi:acyl-CoA synthetase (AMP-forming)/AMP-acid ligase II